MTPPYDADRWLLAAYRQARMVTSLHPSDENFDILAGIAARIHHHVSHVGPLVDLEAGTHFEAHDGGEISEVPYRDGRLRAWSLDGAAAVAPGYRRHAS